MAELDRLMSPDFHNALVIEAKRVVAMICAAPSVPDDLKAILRSRQYIDDLPDESAKQQALRTTGTAMCPNFQSKWVIIGCFGSIWIDCVYRGRNCRISINPNATTADDAYQIETL